MDNRNVREQQRKYEDIVDHPGRFEGEKRYVPYFWDLHLMGERGVSVSEKVVSFSPNEDDILLFPELLDVKTLELQELGIGYVIEVGAKTRYVSHPKENKDGDLRV